MSGIQPHPGLGAYSPAKAALIMLCRQLAQEWGPQGIRTNCICPGMIHTPLTEAIYRDAAVLRSRESMVPLGRIGVPDDYPGLVAFLASDDAAFMTGQTISVSGGLTMHG